MAEDKPKVKPNRVNLFSGPAAPVNPPAPPAGYVPVGAIYAEAEKALGITQRTVQWYATEGLIPKPEHFGAEAYYHPRTSAIMLRLTLINKLQTDFRLKLWRIQEVLKPYESKDLPSLVTLLSNLEREYPQYETYTTVGGEPRTRPNYQNLPICQAVLERLKDGTPISDISLIQIEREVDEGSAEDWINSP